MRMFVPYYAILPYPWKHAPQGGARLGTASMKERWEDLISFFHSCRWYYRVHRGEAKNFSTRRNIYQRLNNVFKFSQPLIRLSPRLFTLITTVLPLRSWQMSLQFQTNKASYVINITTKPSTSISSFCSSSSSPVGEIRSGRGWDYKK